MPEIEQIIERVMGEIHQIVKTETVIGDPVQAGELTIIPVSKISFGFAAGSGKDNRGQSGTGGGATVEPVAFLVIDGEGRIQVTNLNDKDLSWTQVVEMVPDAIGKVKRFVEKKRSEKPSDSTIESDKS